MGRHEKEDPPTLFRAVRRENSPLSLSQFARSVGYTPSYLSAVELGHLPPTPDVVLAYETGLGLEAGSLTPDRTSVARILGGAVGHRDRDPVVRRTPGNVIVDDRMALHDRRALLSTMVALVEQAAAESPATIYIVSQRDADEFGDHSDLRSQWTAALRKAMGRGWQVRHAVRLNQDQERALHVIESMFGLLDFEGLYQPYRLEGHDAATDFLVVPGVGALVAIPTSNPERDLGLFSRKPAIVEALVTNACNLTAQATSFVRSISRDRLLEFERMLADIEGRPGDRLLVREGIMHLGVRASWLRADDGQLNQLGLTRSDLDELIDLRTARLGFFEDQIGRFAFRNISTKRSVRELLKTGRYVVPPEAGREGDIDAGLTRTSDALEIVEHALRDLRRHRNYEIALLDDDEIRLLQQNDGQSVVFWMVKGGERTLLETWPTDDEGHMTHVHVAMREPAVGAAFSSHFRKLWNRISARNRDKAHVISWLEGELEAVRSGEAVATG